MTQTLDLLMREVHVPRYAVLSYEHARETAPHLRTRLSFTPRSIILFLLPYYAGETENLSRYAAARDYHRIIRAIGEHIIQGLQKACPEASFFTYGDHSPIDERHAALISGLGIAGDNGLLITEDYGSYIFIGDVLTDVSAERLGAVQPQPIRRCKSCGRCRAACPTGILRGEGNDCLSAITQRKGTLAPHEIALMREYHTVWGCDVCQTVCPYNRSPKLTPIPFFREQRIPKLTLSLLDSMDDGAFSERAFAWRGRGVVRRNLTLLEENAEKGE